MIDKKKKKRTNEKKSLDKKRIELKTEILLENLNRVKVFDELFHHSRRFIAFFRLLFYFGRVLF